MRMVRILCPAGLGIAIVVVPGAALAAQILGLVLALAPVLAGAGGPWPGPSMRWWAGGPRTHPAPLRE